MSVITASCPQCHAQYQLTPEQLSVAGGKVRCGACMTVFQAAPAPVAAPPPAPVAKAPADAPRKPQRSAFVNDQDDLLLSSIDKKKPLNEELISDGDDDFSPPPVEEIQFSDEFDQVLRENGLSNDTGTLVDDEAWAEQLLEEEEDEPAAELQSQQKSGKKKTENAKVADDDPFAVDLEGLDISLELTADEEEAIGAFTKDDLRHRIKPEPLEFALAGRRSLWLNLALGVVAVVALGGLAAQLLYFQFDTLARDPQWRDTYAAICQRVGCTLPDQYRIEDIRASHLGVKSHPHYTQALMVDTIIINHADVDQPFPNVELFFTNTSQQVVAARKFTPEEYLRGELKHATLMPRRQPVHLALEIDDPGRLATGYRMQLSY